jgi:hypothetical protein
VNTKHRKQRLWLWFVVRLGTRDCSPKQFRRFWIIFGSLWALGVVLGALAVYRGDPDSGLFLAICLLMLVVSVVCCGMAVADLRSPRIIQGRVTDCRSLRIKGSSAQGGLRYGLRITIADDAEQETIFRGPDGPGIGIYSHETIMFLAAAAAKSEFPHGDIVRAKVGMRLRWLFEIEPIGFSDPEEEEARQRRDRELQARIAADPQAVLEEIKRKQAKIENRRPR